MKKTILAVLCDLDGVITQTVKIHVAAWQRVFDLFFQNLNQLSSTHLYSFDAAHDYVQFLDGKPRIDGVRDYLSAKNIKIAMGEMNDEGLDSIYGLVYQKNKIFLELLHEQGVDVYSDNIRQLQHWQRQGMPLAVVSYSKNCRRMLDAANLSSLFKVCVDGQMVEKNHLPGKPHPDKFLFAAKMLNISPQHLMVVEDAVAGIQAAKKGQFGLSVAVIRPDNKESMAQSEPDIMISHLGELDYVGHSICFSTGYHKLPNAITQFSDLSQKLPFPNVVIFSDYDGTLTPIVKRPEEAFLNADMQQVLNELSQRLKIVIISGRDRKCVRELVNLPHLIYVGDHGLDMEDSSQSLIDSQKLDNYLSSINQIRHDLWQKLSDVSRIQFEPKKFTLAIHYRNIESQHEQAVITTVEQVIKNYPDLKIVYGKKVLEIYPNIDWHKGKALNAIFSQMQFSSDVVPLYMGDDLTDENAFRALPERGVGILVGDHGQATYADFRLEDPKQVKDLLRLLITLEARDE